MKQAVAFQDQIPGNHCFGCGPNNTLGLQIKSYWQHDNVSRCCFMPATHHSAGPAKFLNGGIISTIMDCHCVCTAIAKGYSDVGREIGQGERVWFATGKLDVVFKQPVPIDQEVELIATITSSHEKKITLECLLLSGGKTCAEGNVVAVKVPNEWFEG